MINWIKNWIKNNKFASFFIIATLAVALFFGIWYGVSYLQFEDYHLTPVGGELRERVRTDGVVYHHTASSDRPITAHHQWHLTRGWLMAGYNFHIRADGTIEIGRPHNTVGAHAGATANSRTIGVAFSGNLDRYPPTEKQIESAIQLHYWLETEAEYGELEIWGHNDFMSTSCPGKYLDLNVIKKGIEKLREEGRVVENKRENIEVDPVDGFVQGKKITGYLIIKEGRVYIPVRYVSEELGYDVNWDSKNRIWYVD